MPRAKPLTTTIPFFAHSLAIFVAISRPYALGLRVPTIATVFTLFAGSLPRIKSFFGGSGMCGRSLK